MRFEVGQPVTIDTNDYMNSLKGIILDVSASHNGIDAMYTVDVDECGTHFFYGHSLVDAEEPLSVYR